MSAQTARDQLITQHELHRCRRLDKEIKEAEGNLARLRGERKDLSDFFMAQVDDDVYVEYGSLELEIVQSLGRKSVRWKSICLAELGAEFVAATMSTAKRSKGKRSVRVTLG